jgi:hypothetical protein
VEELFVAKGRKELLEGTVIMDELLITTLFVRLFMPAVDLLAAVNTDIVVIDTATNVIIKIFGVLSNGKG